MRREAGRKMNSFKKDRLEAIRLRSACDSQGASPESFDRKLCIIGASVDAKSKIIIVCKIDLRWRLS